MEQEDDSDFFDYAPTSLEVIAAAVSCSRQLVRRIDRDLRGQGLTWSQFNALVQIDTRRGWIHAAAVARRAGVSRQAASGLFAKLDQRGFLVWWDEGWIKSVQLTNEGREALRHARGAVAETLEAIERMSKEERRALKKAEQSIRLELSRPPIRRSQYWEDVPPGVREEVRDRPLLDW
jgi:DNA-binding MarR family transcriptional regulator